VLEFSLSFVFAFVFVVTTCSFGRARSNRGARIAAAIEITTIPRMKAPKIPTTHGHTRLRATGVPGETYEPGG
jgi:hypothetical protein